MLGMVVFCSMSGTPAGNGRPTAGNTTSLTSRPGSLIMLGTPQGASIFEL